ncbi:Major Facilitator Superfamily protein [Agrococcus baldri]|uniref:Major Facilitator Superfamily protein n=1 Tax=Agrococcus baldri TaxID=153730 RepID=A0AA94HLX5_9MICO|nr:MFS transporter [Agrococcus baldri]SFS08812.1 Major Facilitator Superfamily protein [Agrococcus baldri]
MLDLSPRDGAASAIAGPRQLAASAPIRTAVSGTQIAIPILTVEITGDLALGAALVAVALVPSIVAAPLAGALLDRARRPRALLIAAAAGMAVAYGIAAALGPVPVWAVAAALAVSGLLTPFGFGGLSSFVAPPGSDARRAYALDALSYNVGGVAGPAIVAALAPTLGARWALAAMAVIALVSLAAYPLLPMRPRDAKHPGLLRSMGAGITAMVVHRRLAVVTISGTLAELGRGIMPIAAIGIALLATGDASLSALIVAGYAVGALIGAVIEPLRRRTLSAHATLGIGYALVGLATLAAAIDLGIGWTVALIALSGLCSAAPTAAMLLLRRDESPAEVVAQVFTMGAALRTTASAAGTALAGALAGLDPLLMLALSGGIWLLSAAAMLAFPRGR